MATAPARMWEYLRRPAVQDAAVAAMLLVVSLASLWNPSRLVDYDFREPDVLGVVLVVVTTTAVAWRSRFPLGALVLSLAAALPLTHLGYHQSVNGVGSVLILYSVAVARPFRVSVTAAGLTGFAVATVLATSPIEPTLGDWSANVLVFATAWVLGRSVRVRRAHHASVELGEQALAEARESEARNRLALERSRMAREIQDLVAHNLTEINVQVAVARRLLDRDPDRARQILLDAEATGRAAMEEMRRAFELLSQPDAEADLRPQPGLEELQVLVDRELEDGVEVSYAAEGTPSAVTPGVALAVYRVAEEGLRNARLHAPGSPVELLLSWAPENLRLLVSSGTATVSPRWEQQADESTGTLGRLRSRVATYGGELTWGRRRDGGFRVSATFPLTDTARVP